MSAFIDTVKQIGEKKGATKPVIPLDFSIADNSNRDQAINKASQQTKTTTCPTTLPTNNPTSTTQRKRQSKQ